MILSRALGFIFIKGHKVGGTSVEMALSMICGPQDVVTPITFRDERSRFIHSGATCRNYGADEQALSTYLSKLNHWVQGDDIPKHPPGHFRNHMSLAEVQAVGTDTKGLRLIFCERSPYEKVLSFANWSLRAPIYNKGERIEISDYQLRSRLNEIFACNQLTRVRNIDLYRDQTGKLPPFLMMRTRRLQADFDAFMSGLGIKGEELPWAKKTVETERNIMSLLNRWQMDAINKAFEDEFDAFGFERL